MPEPAPIRPLRLEDAEALSALVTGDREFQAPWEPHRSEEFRSPRGQRTLITDLLAQQADGRTRAWMIMDGHEPVGRITLGSIERGAFRSGRLGYWVVSWANGRGLATAAVRAVVQIAFDELGLHRVEAGTLVDNPRSQRVLAKAGFTRFGLAPQYLQIGGVWRDHVLFQLLSTDPH